MFIFIKKSFNRLLPLVAPILWLNVFVFYFINKLFKSESKKILLIAQNGIAADHLKLILNLFNNDKRLSFFVTNDKLTNSYFTRKDIAESFNLPYLNVILSLFLYWDLIIYVNHPWGFALWFSPLIKKLYINHGICTGKINNDKGEDGVYGPCRVMRPYSYPFYDVMFSSSYFEKYQAIKATPQLDKRIKVTGFLRADLLQKLQDEKRFTVRKKLGYADDQVLIHIISTWGPNSLFQTIGEELLSEAVKLSNNYKFQFSLHPRHDEFGDIKGRKRIDILNKYRNLGIRIVDDFAWDEYVVAADLAISDHTSMSLYYVLLDKPVVLVPVQDESFVPGSAFDQLRNSTTALTLPSQLELCIENATKNNISEQYDNLKKTIRNYPGDASNRYKEEIYKILGTSS